MEPKEAPWRKGERRSGMELAVLSETGQYRIAPERVPASLRRESGGNGLCVCGRPSAACP
jgi:hypothetical protein